MKRFLSFVITTLFLIQTPAWAGDKDEAPSPVDYVGIRVCSLSGGGGTRSIIELELLKQLEKDAKRPVLDLFHIFSGSGIGGVFALALAYGKTVDDCLSWAEIHFASVFHTSLKDDVITLGGVLGPRYNPQGQRKALEELFGIHAKLSDIKNAMAHVIAQQLADQAAGTQPRPYAFESWRTYNTPSKDAHLVDVAMAAWATPFHFPAHRMAFVDGSERTFSSHCLQRSFPGALCHTAISQIQTAFPLPARSHSRLVISEIQTYGFGCGRLNFPGEPTDGPIFQTGEFALYAGMDTTLDVGDLRDRAPNRTWYCSPAVEWKDRRMTETDKDHFKKLQILARSHWSTWDERLVAMVKLGGNFHGDRKAIGSVPRKSFWKKSVEELNL